MYRLDFIFNSIILVSPVYTQLGLARQIKPSSAKQLGCVLFQCYDILPAGGWILAPKLMFNGISKGISFSLTAFRCILLTTKNDELSAINFVKVVNDGIQSAHLLNLFGSCVEEVLLDGGVWCNSHDNNASFLIVIVPSI